RRTHADAHLTPARPGDTRTYPVGDAAILAVGAEPLTDVVAEVEATGIAYTRIGDCNQPGDFLSALRDASLATFAALNHA
ncbi:MAG: hypothetical protein VW405_08655, partial [Rhodospirillaceae bacterium]